jgi:hypothetical protein
LIDGMKRHPPIKATRATRVERAPRPRARAPRRGAGGRG